MQQLLLFILALYPLRQGYVNDFSHTLQPDTSRFLEKQLAAFQRDEGVPLVIVVVPGLGGKPISDVSQEYFANWQIGHVSRDSGILLLLAPKEAQSYIDLGYGLEDSINEKLAKEISEKVVNPLLAKGAVDQAAIEAARAIFMAFQYTLGGSPSSSFFSNRVLLIFLGSIPLLYLVARFAATRFFFLSPIIGFALGCSQSFGLGVVLGALGLVMVFLSYIIKTHALRR